MKVFSFHFPAEIESGYGLPERMMFCSLAMLNESKTIVEIGVGAGNSAIFLAKAAQENKGQYIGYDCWSTHGQQKQFPAWGSMEEVGLLLRQQGLERCSILYQVDTFSKEFEELLPSEIDFALIDGDHSYRGVQNDFKKIAPRLSEKAIVVFHDTLVIDGVREFLLELAQEEDVRGYLKWGMFTLPFGTLQRRVGITWVRRMGSSGVEIDEICGSPSDPDLIYQREADFWGYRL